MWKAKRHIAESLLTAALLLLAGCDGSGPEEMLDDYASRVSNTLDEPIETDFDVAGRLPLFPARRERSLPLTDLRQGLVEVLALRHCDLLHLIAERNSSLGKVMAPSQQLVYEMRFLARLRDCRRDLDSAPSPDPDLLAQVNAIYSVKSRELPVAIWNAVYASSEMEVNFSRGDPPMPLEPDGSALAALSSLEQLTDLAALAQLPDWPLPALLDVIEQPYQTLNRNRFGSQWLKSLLLLTETLERTARGLESRERRYPLCPQYRPTPDARILLNVFTQYYAGAVQPYLARVHRDGSRWRDLHLTLMHQLPATEAMQQYRWQVFAGENPDSLWQRYILARDHHTSAWQAVLRRCGLMPGVENTADS
ncbi:DUF3080 family protein [Marinobacterium aestuariivivens]|uniref:DUF3080 family protein n=1 Tax=Marinobacterium aestuariivivens TaxID=1698799 RepID=A0ABW2A7Q5_9GAMM